MQGWGRPAGDVGNAKVQVGRREAVVDEAETRLWSIKVADIACGLCSGQRRPEVRV